MYLDVVKQADSMIMFPRGREVKLTSFSSFSCGRNHSGEICGGVSFDAQLFSSVQGCTDTKELFYLYLLCLLFLSLEVFQNCCSPAKAFYLYLVVNSIHLGERTLENLYGAILLGSHPLRQGCIPCSCPITSRTSSGKEDVFLPIGFKFYYMNCFSDWS